MFCLSTQCLWLALCLPLVVLQPALAAQRKAALRSAQPPPTPASACRTDGIWYSPLGSRTVETVEGCKSRCKSEGQAYFNSFPNGGCHCASSTATTSVNSGNPTAGSGSVDCYEAYYYTSTSPNRSCQLLHQITTSSACQEAAAEAGGTFQYNIHYSVWNQWYAGCNRVGDRFYFKGNFATADDFNEIPENRRSVCLVPIPALFIGKQPYWRLSNAGVMSWRPVVKNLMLFSDSACTQNIAVHAQQLTCSGQSPYGGGTCECVLASSGCGESGWRPQNGCAAGRNCPNNRGDPGHNSYPMAGMVSMTIHFPTGADVKCATVEGLGWAPRDQLDYSPDGTTWTTAWLR